MNSCL